MEYCSADHMQNLNRLGISSESINEKTREAWLRSGCEKNTHQGSLGYVAEV